MNTVIAASSTLKHDGWLILNLYPERATSPSELKRFDQGLWAENWSQVESLLDRFNATEVLGAWGNPPNDTIKKAETAMLEALVEKGIRAYYFDALTKKGSPRHPTPRGPKWDVTGSKKWLF